VPIRTAISVPGAVRKRRLAALLASILALSGCTTPSEKVVVHDIRSPARSSSDTGKNPITGFFASLADPSAAPAQRSRAVYGTGEFLGEPAPSILKAAAKDVDGRTYMLNLVGATVPEAAAAVLGNISHLIHEVYQFRPQVSEPTAHSGLAAVAISVPQGCSKTRMTSDG
jgi:hypothetical protein